MNEVVGGGCVLEGVTEGGILDTAAGEFVGAVVATSQAANCIARVKMMNKSGVWFEVFIANPKSN